MDPDIARLAAAVTEPARAAILVHLLDGRSWTATELAKVAGTKAAAMSAHLKKLLGCGLIKVSPLGRHRYYRLAGAPVAGLIEQLQGFAPPPRPAATPGERRAAVALRTCRLCYDHLAGALGVAITEAMVKKSWLVEDGPWYRLTDTGNAGLSALAVEPMPGRICIDWTERKPHVAGPLGTQLAQAMLQEKLMLRDAKSRALRVTALGKETLGRVFGICVERLQIACKESSANAPASEQIDDGQQNDCTDQ